MKIENKINQKLEIKRLPNTFIYSFSIIIFTNNCTNFKR